MLIIGIIYVPDYGVSTDEWLYTTYAQQVLEIVGGIRDTTDTLTNLRYYGPVFSVSSLILARVIEGFIPAWDLNVAVHFTYYLSFVLGVCCFYLICIRFTGVTPSTLATLLFATQPVLFGHAFINPKDIPFMSFFLLSMLLGFWTSDALNPPQKFQSLKRILAFLKTRLHTTKTRWCLTKRFSKATFLILITLSGVYLWGLFTGKWLLIGKEVIEAAYFGQSWGPINALFNYFAQDAWKTDISAYHERFMLFYPWINLFITIAALTAVLYQSNRVFGTRSFWKEITSNKSTMLIIGASISFGLTNSIRVGGLLVGFLVCLLFILRFRSASVLPILFYGVVGISTTYLTWPFLWRDPLAKSIEVIRVMMNFRHPGTQLFEGNYYHPWELPRIFLPKMMAIQFTIPLVVLFLIGVVLVIFQITEWKKSLSQELLVIVLWFSIPMTLYLILRTPIYNNFRQLLFIIPPLFVIVALAIKFVLTYLTRWPLRIGLVIMILLPGVIGIIQLHPYEYIYYNQFIGGVNGAKGEYHLDYLCSSYAEGTHYLNSVAESNSKVAVAWEMHLVNPYARDDLRLFAVTTEEEVLEINADYLIACTRFGEFFPNVPVEYSVERDGGALTTIKKIK